MDPTMHRRKSLRVMPAQLVSIGPPARREGLAPHPDLSLGGLPLQSRRPGGGRVQPGTHPGGPGRQAPAMRGRRRLSSGVRPTASRSSSISDSERIIGERRNCPRRLKWQKRIARVPAASPRSNCIN